MSRSSERRELVAGLLSATLNCGVVGLIPYLVYLVLDGVSGINDRAELLPVRVLCGAGHLARAPAVRKAEHPVPAQVGGKRQRLQGNQISRCKKTGDSPGTSVTHQVAESVVNRQSV